jgi:hypothetical protein
MSDALLADLDAKLAAFATKLRDDLRIAPPASNALATTIRSDIASLDIGNLPNPAKDNPLSLKDRYIELQEFLLWMQQRANDPNCYGQLLSANYMCFVYLKDAYFEVLRDQLPKHSVAYKCCVFLTQDPIRAFRNALAHGNWRLILDRSGIDFWDRDKGDRNKPPLRFRLNQNDLHFAQYLAIATAYASMLVL